MLRPGYIKLWRSLLDKPIWKQSTPEHKTVLITLLMMADFMPSEWEYKNKKYVTEPGQFVTSLNKIADECGKAVTVQNVRSALARFERLGFITNKSTNTNRLITIVNWDVYQSKEVQTNKATNIVSNKQLTSNQQATNKQLTTNKEVKKLRSKEVKNVVVVNNEFKEIYNMYQSNIQLNPPPTTTQRLQDDFDYFGKDIMAYVIEKSALANNHDYRFIDFLLKEWRRNQLTTVEAVKQYEDKKQSKSKNNTRYNNNQDYTNKYPDRPDLSFSALTLKSNEVGFDKLTKEEQKALESYY